MLIDRAVDNLRVKLLEEFVVVALVVRGVPVPPAVGPGRRGHAAGRRVWRRSSSCTGRASARTSCRSAASRSRSAPWSTLGRAGRGGAQAHRSLRGRARRRPDAAERWQLVSERAVEVGPALFFSLLVITLSFLPVFTLEAQEGPLFSPLAFTKTYAMAAAAGSRSRSCRC
jgi:Cu(I)/Ag(I) efflux system membrane protein CusA/SilA